MLSSFAKWCLAYTAVSPALGAAAVVAYWTHGSAVAALSFLGAGVLAFVLLCLMLRFVRRYVSEKSIACTEITHADQNVLEFLLAYLLPVFSATSQSTLVGSVSLTAYSLGVVLLTVVNGDLFLFNPVLAALGYHFYFVKDSQSVQYLLISKKAYHKGDRNITYRPLGEYMFLDSAK